VLIYRERLRVYVLFCIRIPCAAYFPLLLPEAWPLIFYKGRWKAWLLKIMRTTQFATFSTVRSAKVFRIGLGDINVVMQGIRARDM
jgi:hypothetical protein